MKIDLIIPAFNEEGNLENLYSTIKQSLKDVKYNIIFVDDGSTDGTYKVLTDIYNKDKKCVKVIRFSRNFGKDAAIYAGLEISNAKYACIIDADLQQDPNLINDMINILERDDSYDMVAMVNDYSNENKLSKFLKKSFYYLMNRVSAKV